MGITTHLRVVQPFVPMSVYYTSGMVYRINTNIHYAKTVHKPFVQIVSGPREGSLAYWELSDTHTHTYLTHISAGKGLLQTELLDQIRQTVVSTMYALEKGGQTM